MFVIMLIAMITICLVGSQHIGLISTEHAMIGMLLSAVLIVADLIGLYLYNHYDKVSCDDCMHVGENKDIPTCSMRTCSMREYSSNGYYMSDTMIEPLCYLENHDGKCTDFIQNKERQIKHDHTTRSRLEN